jgi:autotransporter translocation and assembly factor TamB
VSNGPEIPPAGSWTGGHGARSAENSPAGPPAPARRRFARLRTITRRTFMAVAGLLVGLVVGALVVDWGPMLRGRAEREASRLIERPLHIGRLSMNLLRGRFTLDDLVIEGLTPEAPAFFRARRIVVLMPWWTVFRREVFIESVTLTDWTMQVETYPNGRHNFIRIPGGGRRNQPRRFVTTVQLVRATRGEFVYRDTGTPWSTVARNLDLTIARLLDYRGEARFSNGTVAIQQFEPMWANMYCTFRIDGGRVILDRIDLDTDGARSKVTGVVNLARWPEQTYQVVSQVDFPRAKDIWFAKQGFTLAGTGEFRGTFALFKGGRDLTGTFRSDEAGLDAFRFPNLAGRLRWRPDRFEVTEASSGLYGGRATFTYSMAPLGDPARPAVARFDARYDNVDLLTFTEFIDRPGLRLAGRVSGRNLLEWPLGRFRDRRGSGRLVAAAPPGVPTMARAPVERLIEAFDARGPDPGPFNHVPLIAPLDVAGEISYQYGPDTIEIAPSWAASPQTYLAFEGTTRYGRDSRIPFHVTSGDWQESDRVLAGIIMAVTGSARAVPVGGVGTFDGVMLGAFNAPRVEGQFAGDRMRAWDVTWGRGSADLVIENGYVRVRDAVIQKQGGRLDVDGRFALGYPRRDGGEEIDARVRVSRFAVADFRHAFAIDDYPVEGELSGEFHVYDKYEAPQGFGRLAITDGAAYGEPFDQGHAGLTFEGRGVRIDGIELRKRTGRITGAAYIGWNGTYSFNADARAIPMDSVASVAYPQAPFSGELSFTASGSGTFAAPRYEVRGRIDDLFVGDEGIGQVTGALTARDQTLTIDVLEVASSRLAISGSGRIAMTPQADADLRFRFTDTSLDPYVRAVRPGFSPFTTVVASGSVRAVGELRNPDQLRAEVVADQVDLGLFDYHLRNDGPVRFDLDNQVLRLERLRLVGDGTQLEMVGDIRMTDQRISLRALGDANLGILQGVLRNVRSSGAAEIQADVRGTLSEPLITGAATLIDGRLRHFSLPHAIERLNGRLTFGAGGLSVEGVTGRVGAGDVRFDGRIGFRGFQPTEYGLGATGTGMRIRYPEGFRSIVDAELALRGPFASPVLSGTVNVQSAVYERAFDPAGGNLFGMAAGGGARAPAPAPAGAGDAFPLGFDVRIVAPNTLRIENRAARLVSSAELTLRGSYEKPQLFGRVEVTRGLVFFEGNRYDVTRGVVDFANPQKIEPFFDVEAETQARVPGQIYRIVFHVTGVPESFVFDLTSDPPLTPVEILALLLGDTRDPQDAELRALRTPGRTEQEVVAAGATRLLASPLSSEVGRVVEQTLGVDTVQIAPSLGDISALQSARLNPSARVTLGKRLSDRLYLTYSQSLSTSSQDQIILIEYNQTDRLSWIVSQNEDRTFALDVRVRHVF